MRQVSGNLEKLSGEIGGGVPRALILFGIAMVVALVAGLFSPALGFALVAVGLLAVVLYDYVTWSRTSAPGRH